MVYKQLHLEFLFLYLDTSAENMLVIVSLEKM